MCYYSGISRFIIPWFLANIPADAEKQNELAILSSISMIRFNSIPVVLIIIGKIMLNAQISVPSGLTKDSGEKQDNDLIK